MGDQITDEDNKRFDATHPTAVPNSPVIGSDSDTYHGASLDQLAGGVVIGGGNDTLPSQTTDRSLMSTVADASRQISNPALYKQANPDPVITPEATQPRTSPTLSTPLTDAVKDPPVKTWWSEPNTATPAPSSLDSTSAAAPLIQTNTRTELAMANARDAQAGVENAASQERYNAQVQARVAGDKAGQEKRVADFLAKNGAVVSGHGGTKAQIQGVQGAAAAADANFNAANQRIIGASAPGPVTSPIDNEVKIQAAIQAGQNAGLNQATGQVQLQSDKLKLEQQKTLADLSTKLISATSPKDRKEIGANIATLLGKEHPSEWKAVHAAGGQRLGPDGLTAIKDPDHVVLVNERTGESQAVALPGSASTTATPLANHIDALKKDPKKYKALFEAKYGKGSADQYTSNSN